MTRAPAVLLPYQQAWLADTSQVKIWEKSRRIGASWAEACDAALIAASIKGSDYWYVGYSREMAQEFIGDVADWARHLQGVAAVVEETVVEDEGKDILAFRIRFASGWRVTALSSRPNNLRGKQGVVCIDEAAFHPDLSELLKAALALLIWGGRVRIVSTHDGVLNAFNQLVQDCRSGKLGYSVHRTTFAEAVEQGLYQRICLRSGRPWSPESETTWVAGIYAQYGSGAAEELDVVPSQSGGRYLPHVLIEACTDDSIPVVRLALTDDWALKSEADRVDEIAAWCLATLRPLLATAEENLRSCYGFDFGRSGDLSVLLPAQEQANLARRALFVLELRNVPFEAQRQILFFVTDRLPRFVAGWHDATGNGAYLAEVAAMRYGTRIQQVKLNAPWYLEHFPRYKAAFEDRRVLLPADADVVADHGEVVVVNGVPLVPSTGSRKGTDGGQRHGDAAIAGVLMWSASLSSGGPIEFQSAPPSAASRGADRFAWGGRTAPGSADVEGGFGTLPGIDTSSFTRP